MAGAQRGGSKVSACDIDPLTLDYDYSELERTLSRSQIPPLAILSAHLYGLPADVERICQLARPRGIPVIEDAAHSIGAEYGGRRVGGIADMTAFSFYATKNITSGEGGALTTNNDDWAERASIMALHGISRDAWKRYGNEGYKHWDIVYPGYKYNMFDIQGALALSQLAKLERFHQRRVALKARLDAGLADLPEIVLAQDALALVTDLAHNLLSWVHHAVLETTPFADFGTQRMVRDLLCIPGRLEFREGKLCKVALLDTHPFAPEMRLALGAILAQCDHP